MEEQFPREYGYRISRFDEFQFARVDEDPCIKLLIPEEHDLYCIAVEPRNAEVSQPHAFRESMIYTSFLQIRASEINFWSLSLESMKLRHEMKTYPPRVKMIITTKGSDLRTPIRIKFKGSTRDSSLDTDIIFPLGVY